VDIPYKAGLTTPDQHGNSEEGRTEDISSNTHCSSAWIASNDGINTSPSANLNSLPDVSFLLIVAKSFSVQSFISGLSSAF